MSFFFAVGGAYLALSGLFFLLFPQRWRRLVTTLSGLKPGQLRSVGMLLVIGGALLLLLGARTHLVVSAMGAYLILEGVLPLFSPQLWRRMIGEMLAASPDLLRNVGVVFLGGGMLLVWATL